jgi:CheY-like chemotaxis protein
MNLINVLLVEDDQLDVIDIRRSLDKLGINYSLNVASNGEEALEYLNEKDKLGKEFLPDFTLIDINMPKLNGFEFLEAIRGNKRWEHLKCFIITTSDEAVDRKRALTLNVSGYIVKPLKLNSPSTMAAFNLMIDLINFKNEAS